jgi:hypothetical protein
MDHLPGVPQPGSDVAFASAAVLPSIQPVTASATSSGAERAGRPAFFSRSAC